MEPPTLERIQVSHTNIVKYLLLPLYHVHKYKNLYQFLDAGGPTSVETSPSLMPTIPYSRASATRQERLALSVNR